MEGFTDRIGPEVVRTVVAEVGMATALWSVDPYWALFAPNGPRVAGEGPGAADIAAYVVDAAGPGSIVHLSAESLDVEALPAIIDGLRSKGLEPTTLTGLFEMQDRQLEGDIVLDGDRPAA
jgi:peptidoglycan/xylan/chitin deacetylase (PgdA/CDA1 family)